MPYRLVKPQASEDEIRKNPRSLDTAAIRWRRLLTSLGILAGYAALAACIWGVLHWSGWDLIGKVGYGFLWLAMTLVMWLGSAKIAVWMNKCKLADPNNPRHQRGLKAAARAFAGTGYNPPVYCSPDPRGNAFATGPFPAWAVVAFTEGILDIENMTDDELYAVFCHEASHVLDWHVAINSLAGALSMTFILLVQAAVQVLLGGINLFRRVVGLRPLAVDETGQRHGFLSGLLMNVVFYLVFYVASSFTRIFQFFIVRSAESQADAGAAAMTGQPCLLVSALEHLVEAAEKNRPQGYAEMVWRQTRLISIIDPIYDGRHEQPKPQGVWEWIKHWWKQLQLTHPPVPVRRKHLEQMNGGPCSTR
jgi:Zn-dependent protease with chaperone function